MSTTLYLYRKRANASAISRFKPWSQTRDQAGDLKRACGVWHGTVRAISQASDTDARNSSPLNLSTAQRYKWCGILNFGLTAFTAGIGRFDAFPFLPVGDVPWMLVNGIVAANVG